MHNVLAFSNTRSLHIIITNYFVVDAVKRANYSCFFVFLQNQQLEMLIVPDCMVSSLMKLSVTCSGIAGTVRHLGINALPVWHTIVKLVFVCGLIKFQSAEMKVSSFINIYCITIF